NASASSPFVSLNRVLLVWVHRRARPSCVFRKRVGIRRCAWSRCVAAPSTTGGAASPEAHPLSRDPSRRRPGPAGRRLWRLPRRSRAVPAVPVHRVALPDLAHVAGVELAARGLLRPRHAPLHRLAEADDLIVEVAAEAVRQVGPGRGAVPEREPFSAA